MSLRDQLLQNFSLEFDGDIFRQKEFVPPSDFEKTYLAVREKEGRIYTDEGVKELPRFKGDDLLCREWLRRDSSFKNMKKYTGNKSKPAILEIGCGNGWFANGLAQLPEVQVCAVDVNETELRQAARVFGSQKNLNFLYGDVLTTSFGITRFDMVILAASLPYFNDVRSLVHKLMTVIADNGEIHILDSPFYHSPADKQQARQRSLNHFQKLGFPEMADRYFHHALEDFGDYPYELRFNPNTLAARVRRMLLQTDEPVFPWIIIRK